MFARSSHAVSFHATYLKDRAALVHFGAIIAVTGILIFGAICVVLGSSGYGPGDAPYYLRGADGWLAHVPFIGNTHWELRHPFILSIAASFRLFGRTEAAMALPSLISYFGILLLTFQIVLAVVDRPTAVLASILVASTPLFAGFARIPTPDEMQLFLSLLSFSLFLRGGSEGNRIALLFSGIVLGIDWMVRELCAPLLVLYAILFVVGYRIRRRDYLFIAVGFAALVAGEILFYYVTVRDPLYRFIVDARSLDLPGDVIHGGSFHGLRPPFNVGIMKGWVQISVIHVNWFIDPYIDLFTNPNYGFIHWTGICALLVLNFRGAALPRITDFSRLISGWALLSLVILIYVMNVHPQPRYFGNITWAMAVTTAVWLSQRVYPERQVLAVTAIAAIIVAHVSAINLRRDPQYPSHVLASYARTTNERIWSNEDIAGFKHGEDVTRHRFIFESAGVSDRIWIGAPESLSAGSLYFATSSDAAPLENRGWQVVWTSKPHFALVAAALQIFATFVPGKVKLLLTRGYPELRVLRAP